MDFQVAVVEMSGANRMTLRALNTLVTMFQELPAPAPGRPPRPGGELIDLWNEMHPDDEEPDVNGVGPSRATALDSSVGAQEE